MSVRMTWGPAVRIALAVIMVAGLGMNAHAQNLSSSGTGAEAVTGISSSNSFPINITKPGSYRLNSNLTVKKSGVDAIDVKVSNVTIDLSGFTITGGVVGINGLSFGAANVTVVNGSITGSGGGVLLTDGAVVRNVRLSDLTGSSTGFANAIACGSSCTVSSNTIYNITASNPGGPPAAIAAGGNSLILNNTVTGTGGGTGIVTAGSGNSLVSGNTTSNNANSGILIGAPGVIISHNTANNNGAYGLDFISVPGAYEDNVLLNNVTDVKGGTSLAGGNTNLCTSGVC